MDKTDVLTYAQPLACTSSQHVANINNSSNQSLMPKLGKILTLNKQNQYSNSTQHMGFVFPNPFAYFSPSVNTVLHFYFLRLQFTVSFFLVSKSSSSSCGISCSVLGLIHLVSLIFMFYLLDLLRMNTLSNFLM